MWVWEAAIILYGMSLVFANYQSASKEKKDPLCSSGLLSQLLISNETMMTPVEYFISGEYSIVFKRGKMVDIYNQEQEPVAFLVTDKDPETESYLKKNITPLLESMLTKFISQYTGCDVTEMAQFESFKGSIDEMFKNRNIKEIF